MKCIIVFNQNTADLLRKAEKEYYLQDVFFTPKKEYVIGETYLGERGEHGGEAFRCISNGQPVKFQQL